MSGPGRGRRLVRWPAWPGPPPSTWPSPFARASSAASGSQLVAGLACGGGGCAIAIALSSTGQAELHLGPAGSPARGPPGPGPLRAGRWYRARAVLDLDGSDGLSLGNEHRGTAPDGGQGSEPSLELRRPSLPPGRRRRPRPLGSWRPPGKPKARRGRVEAVQRQARSAHRFAARRGEADRRPFEYAWRLGQGATSSELPDTSTEQVPLAWSMRLQPASPATTGTAVSWISPRPLSSTTPWPSMTTTSKIPVGPLSAKSSSLLSSAAASMR